ncbi:MAG: hypothetical protein KDB61_10060, partial [Planctomycetes bacterium]|nr:hypothetical protein [Planctomycetota bacterium]
MRALFWKDSLLLSAFLAFGLMVFSAMVFELGFDRAFVLPFSPMPEELIWGWVLWAAGFGWMLGATDRLRGVVGYVEHRGFSKARLFSTQLANGGLVLLAVLILPWCFLAILDRGLFEPDFMGLGSRWLWASTIALPCFGVGIFTAKLPLHWGIRLVVAAAALPWVVGERPELAILTPMHFGPLGFAARNLVACAVLLLAAYLADKAQGDRDIPLGRAA